MLQNWWQKNVGICSGLGSSFAKASINLFIVHKNWKKIWRECNEKSEDEIERGAFLSLFSRLCFVCLQRKLFHERIGVADGAGAVCCVWWCCRWWRRWWWGHFWQWFSLVVFLSLVLSVFSRVLNKLQGKIKMSIRYVSIAQVHCKWVKGTARKRE